VCVPCVCRVCVRSVCEACTYLPHPSCMDLGDKASIVALLRTIQLARGGMSTYGSHLCRRPEYLQHSSDLLQLAGFILMECQRTWARVEACHD
jgi:hypothetical protein